MKRLVICFDGTWNSADGEDAETNVARIARAIPADPEGREPQLVLYLRGVGSTGIAAERVIAGALGRGVDDNIRSSYMFLAQNYVPGDEIYLFGFSRGAFTARSLAGFVGCCGLLRRQDLKHLGGAWEYYRAEKTRSRAGFCERCEVETHEVDFAFVGVWDTVGALGVPGNVFSPLNRERYGFHDTSPSLKIRRGYHALAIDEHRDEFVPTLWTGEQPAGSTIEQVWFAGAHSDVGGGYAEHGLSDIPLWWMAEKAEDAGLAIDRGVLPTLGPQNAMAERHDSRDGWSVKDRLSPTFRCVEEREFPVAPYERLHRPRDEQNRTLPTINESVHPSVLLRLGQPDRVKGGSDGREYRPRNLAHLG